MNKVKSQIKMRVLVLCSIGLMAFSTLACVKTDGGGPCDITGPDTAVTTCLAGVVIK
jgi:hypothetical protein